MDSWPPKMTEKEKRIFDRMMIRKAKEQFRAGGWSCRATRKRFKDSMVDLGTKNGERSKNVVKGNPKSV